MRRIDARHANAVAAWRRMREPQFPSPAQLARLARESEMAEAPLLIRRARGGVSFSVTVPPQGVVAIEFAARDSPAPSGTRGC
jgi:hypothetical protein